MCLVKESRLGAARMVVASVLSPLGSDALFKLDDPSVVVPCRLDAFF